MTKQKTRRELVHVKREDQMMVLERVFGRVFDDADDLGMDIERVDLAGTAVDIEQEVTQLELRLHRGFRGIERGYLGGKHGDLGVDLVEG